MVSYEGKLKINKIKITGNVNVNFISCTLR